MRNSRKFLRLAVAPMLAGTIIGTPAIAEDKEPVAIPAPPAGKGQIVFFRTGTIMGAAMGCAVNENGEKISSLGAGRYFILVTEPGRHEYMVKSEAKDFLALEVEEGETQFALCRIKMGLMAGRPDLRPSTEAEFRKSSTDRLVDDEDMGPAPGALRASEVAAALAPKTESAPEGEPEIVAEQSEAAAPQE